MSDQSGQQGKKRGLYVVCAAGIAGDVGQLITGPNNAVGTLTSSVPAGDGPHRRGCGQGAEPLPDPVGLTVSR